MPLILPNASELDMLERYLSSFGTGQELKLNLYKNDITPADDSEVGDFTAATFTGYSEVEIDPEEWVYSTVGGVAQAVYGADPISWVCTGAGHLVYGYFITSQDGTELKWAERFVNSRNIQTDDEPDFQPKFTLRTDE